MGCLQGVEYLLLLVACGVLSEDSDRLHIALPVFRRDDFDWNAPDFSDTENYLGAAGNGPTVGQAQHLQRDRCGCVSEVLHSHLGVPSIS